MFRDWKKMIVLTAGLSLVGLTTAVKADHFGQNDAGAKPRTFSNYQNNGFRRGNQERRLKIYINMRGAERFGYQIQKQLEEIAGDRFRLVQNRNRADIVIGMNPRVSRVNFKQFGHNYKRDRYNWRTEKNRPNGAAFTIASYEVVKERMFMSYDVNVRVRMNGQLIKKRSFDGQVSQKRRYVQNLKGFNRFGWQLDAPAPNRKVAKLIANGSAANTKFAVRQLRQEAARDIAFKISNMRVLNRMAQNVNYQRVERNRGRQSQKPINWKKRIIGSLINEIAFKHHK